MQIPSSAAGPAKGPTGEDASKQANSSTLYIGNLHPYVTQKALEELCKYFGPVEETKVCKDKSTGTNAGFGFVRFESRSAAQAALNSLNGKTYVGHELRVNWAFQNHHGREDTSHHFHIFVGDLGQEVTDGMLYSVFCSIGDCSDARVMWDHGTGRSKGYGFVSFRNKEDADKAIEKLHGQMIGSRKVRCGWAQHKQDETGAAPEVESVDRSDPYNTNVYVGNTPPGWSESDLIRHFANYGEVVEVKLHRKGGYGFVRYAHHAEAVKAIVSVHGTTVDGRVLKCSWGKSINNAGSGTFQSQTVAHPTGMMMTTMQPMMTAGGMLHPGMLGSPMMLQQQPAQLVGLPMNLSNQMMLVGGQPTSPTGMGHGMNPGITAISRGQAMGLAMDPHSLYYGNLYYGH